MTDDELQKKREEWAKSDAFHRVEVLSIIDAALEARAESSRLQSEWEAAMALGKRAIVELETARAAATWPALVARAERAEARVEEYRREVERRDELLAGSSPAAITEQVESGVTAAHGALRAELETARAELTDERESQRRVRNAARAVAFEEAARYVGHHWVAASTAQQFAADLRAQAKLDPALYVVERENGAVEEAWADREEAERHARAMTTSTPRDYKVAHLTEPSPADTRRQKDERAVVRAAQALVREWGRDPMTHQATLEGGLREAVERLWRGGK